jgi:pSer/pThr/pTyr-binding forkhead associated (FHA) protein
MNPALVALFGPLKGSIFRWKEEEISIGRDPSSSLYLNDPLVSRNHCRITKISDQFLIQDLNSRNGIFVDNIPIIRRELQHGNQVKARAGRSRTNRRELYGSFKITGSLSNLFAPFDEESESQIELTLHKFFKLRMIS